MERVVVVVPGIMGSVLKLGSAEIWPGPLSRLVWGFSAADMAALLSDRIVATDCVRSFVLSFYQSLLDDLEAVGLNEKGPNPKVFVAYYDWRKSIDDDGPKQLAQRIKQAVDIHGDDVEITLIAHSMGGLVARYFLETDEYKTAPGRGNVKRLIMLATPNRGAAVALARVLGYEKSAFLNPAQGRQLAEDKRYPGPYQLLPRQGEPVVWNESSPDLFGVGDIYDPAIAGKLGLAPDNLAAALDFHNTLNAGTRPADVAYFCFSGNQQKTAGYARLQPRTSRLEPSMVLQASAGDGTVPLWSSLLPNAKFLYCGGEHSRIFLDGELRRVLKALLGSGILAEGFVTEISLDKLAVEAEDTLVSNLVFSKDTTNAAGFIQIEKVELDATDKPISSKVVAKHDVAYKGPVIRTLAMEFQSPSVPGHYKVSYFDSLTSRQTAEVEAIVQQPSSPTF